MEVAHQVDDDDFQQFFSTNKEAAVVQFGVMSTAHWDREVVAPLLRQACLTDPSEDSKSVVGVNGQRIAAKRTRPAANEIKVTGVFHS